MTREEQIKQAALERDCDGDFDSNDGLNGFIEGAQWADEKPEPLKRICVIDKNGNRDGHLTPLVWDGKHLVKSLAHRLMVDENNIVKWCYYDEI